MTMPKDPLFRLFWGGSMNVIGGSPMTKAALLPYLQPRDEERYDPMLVTWDDTLWAQNSHPHVSPLPITQFVGTRSELLYGVERGVNSAIDACTRSLGMQSADYVTKEQEGLDKLRTRFLLESENSVACGRLDPLTLDAVINSAVKLERLRGALGVAGPNPVETSRQLVNEMEIRLRAVQRDLDAANKRIAELESQRPRPS